MQKLKITEKSVQPFNTKLCRKQFHIFFISIQIISYPKFFLSNTLLWLQCYICMKVYLWFLCRRCSPDFPHSFSEHGYQFFQFFHLQSRGESPMHGLRSIRNPEHSSPPQVAFTLKVTLFKQNDILRVYSVYLCILLCKGKMLYLLTCKVSRYCLLALHGSKQMVGWSPRTYVI